MCCMFWGCFVPNFSGTFCLNKGRICLGCCALNIWIWGACCVKVVYGFLVFYSFHFFISFLLLFYLFWVRFVQVVFMTLGSFVSWHFASWNVNLTNGTFNLFFLFLKLSVLYIVYNVPAVFVLILLGDFLYIVVYIQNIFDIVPFHCPSCPAAVYFYILNISYLYVHSLKCSGTISLNGFLGLKDYFIICLSGSSTVSWLWQSWMSFKLFLHIITALEFVNIAPRQHWCSCSPRLLLSCVALHHIAWHDLLLIAFRSTGCCSTCADKNAKFLMASRAWAWFRTNAAPLGVGTPVVGVLACYAWNATETQRMARQIRRGHFQPKTPADYDHRFCLFDRYMMEKARMVGLVGLKSTGKASTLSHFLREPVAHGWQRLRRNVWPDERFSPSSPLLRTPPSVGCWEKQQEDRHRSLRAGAGADRLAGAGGGGCGVARQCSGLTKGRPSSEDCAECAVGNGKLSPNFHRNPRPPARQGCEVALCWREGGFGSHSIQRGLGASECEWAKTWEADGRGDAGRESQWLPPAHPRQGLHGRRCSRTSREPSRAFKSSREHFAKNEMKGWMKKVEES